MIKAEIKKRQKEKVNLDQSSVKKGHIEKHKYIAKKTYETLVEKARKIPVEIQDNVNPNTYLNQTTQFNKILKRTQQRVVFDQEQLKSGLAAINAFGIAQKEPVLSFTLHFEKEIECEPRPFLM